MWVMPEEGVCAREEGRDAVAGSPCPKPGGPTLRPLRAELREVPQGSQPGLWGFLGGGHYWFQE